MSAIVTLQPSAVDGSPNNYINAIASIAFTGSYVTGGDTLDLSAAASLMGGTQMKLAFADSAGDASSFGAGLGGYFTLVPGATLQTWKIKCWSAGGTELAAGAYPTSLSVAGGHENVLLSLATSKLI